MFPVCSGAGRQLNCQRWQGECTKPSGCSARRKHLMQAVTMRCGRRSSFFLIALPHPRPPPHPRPFPMSFSRRRHERSLHARFVFFFHMRFGRAWRASFSSRSLLVVTPPFLGVFLWAFPPWGLHTSTHVRIIDNIRHTFFHGYSSSQRFHILCETFHSRLVYRRAALFRKVSMRLSQKT